MVSMKKNGSWTPLVLDLEPSLKHLMVCHYNPGMKYVDGFIVFPLSVHLSVCLFINP